MADEVWRHDALGASDAPAIVGVDPWRTAGDVWAEKTGRLPPRIEPDGIADPRRFGQALEPVLVDYAAAKLGRPVARQVWYRHPAAPLACSVDAIALDADPAVLIEAKALGLFGPSPTAAAYGEDGTDEIHEATLIQVHHAFAVLDRQPDVPPVIGALVPVFLGGRGVRLYQVHRDDRLVAELVDLETEWWARHVDGDRCPPIDPPSLPTLAIMRRSADAPVRIMDTTLVAEWRAAKAILDQAEQNEQTCRRMVIAELRDGEVGECQIGRVTYRASVRPAHMVKETTVRSLRFKPYTEREVA